MKKFLSVVILFAFSVVMIIGGLSYNIRDHVAISFDSFSFESDEVTIGSNSGICYEQLPHDMMKISYNQKDSKYHWKLNKDMLSKTDTLPYFLINDKNPQKYTVNPNSVLKVGNKEFSGQAIYDAWEKCSKQQYVLVRNLLSVMTENRDYKNNRKLRSFFSREEKTWFSGKRTGKIELVILDDSCSIDSHHYAYEGTADSLVNNSHCLKLQFYRIEESFLKGKKAEDGMLTIDGVNYTAKPSVILTGWGAGHVMFKKANDANCISVSFPKSNLYIGDYHMLQDKSCQTGGVLSLKQNVSTFPTPNDLYIPQISTQLPTTLCLFQMRKADNSVVLKINAKDSVIIKNSLVQGSGISQTLTPCLRKYIVSSAKDTNISIRAGFINIGTILRFLALPFLCLLALLIAVLCPKIGIFDFDGIHLNNGRSRGYCKNQLVNFKYLFSFLLIISFCFVTVKSFIALKLSYTAPFFERIIDVLPASYIGIIALFYSLCLLINADYYDLEVKNAKKAVSLVITPCLVILGVFLLAISDETLGYTYLQSYLDSNPFTIKFWNWKSFTIVDNYRNIPYALLSCSLLVWIFCIVTAVIKISGLQMYVMQFCIRMKSYLPDKLSVLVKSKNKPTVWIVKNCNKVFLHILIVGCICLSGFFGNFSTAFISIFVILGISFGIQSVVFEATMKSRKNGAGLFLLYGFIYIISAVILGQDNGYLTNAIGIVIAIILFYFLTGKPPIPNCRKIAERKERKTAWGIAFVCFLVMLISIKFVIPFFMQDNVADYRRSFRRIYMFADFDMQRERGYRYTESDEEFMAIMAHYTTKSDSIATDPLSPESNFLHPSVSSGQAPVVLNDLSAPVAFYGSYGCWAEFIHLILLLSLLFIVMYFNFMFTVNDKQNGCNVSKYDFTIQSKRAILAVLMWVGTSWYLYMSYNGVMPFTGRLNPGLGIDSLGEAMESAILLAFMTSIKIKTDK